MRLPEPVARAPAAGLTSEQSTIEEAFAAFHFTVIQCFQAWKYLPSNLGNQESILTVVVAIAEDNSQQKIK